MRCSFLRSCLRPPLPRYRVERAALEIRVRAIGSRSACVTHLKETIEYTCCCCPALSFWHFCEDFPKARDGNERFHPPDRITRVFYDSGKLICIAAAFQELSSNPLKRLCGRSLESRWQPRPASMKQFFSCTTPRDCIART